MSLTPDERRRYKRQLLLPEIGGQGQQALRTASVLVIGAGGLGCPILQHLTGAGVGRIGVCDPDVIDLSNLQRQTLYTVDDIGQPKAPIAARRLLQLNPLLEIRHHSFALDADNAENLIKGYDFIIEGVDRYAPRFILNAACLSGGKPFFSAAIGAFSGQVAFFEPGQGNAPCYACLVPEAPDDEAHCETQGVIGALPGIIGALAALEAIKYICKMPEALTNGLIIYDGMRAQMRRIGLNRDSACPVCRPV